MLEWACAACGTIYPRGDDECPKCLGNTPRWTAEEIAKLSEESDLDEFFVEIDPENKIR